MIVLTVVTAEPGKGRSTLLEAWIGWARGFPTCTGTQLPRFSSGISKDRSGME